MRRHLLFFVALQLSFVSFGLGSEWKPLSGSRTFELTSIRGEASEDWRPLGNLDEWYRLDQLERSRPSGQRLGVLSIDVSGTVEERLGALIEYAESNGSGYDAIHLSAKRLPEQLPTLMTLSDIFEWIRATPGQPHAIGRYQIIPSTLAELTGRLKVPLGTRFSPDVQDEFAAGLFRTAGLSEWLSGTVTDETFMDNLARIWAGLPLESGLSAYDGKSGNRATITREEFRQTLLQVSR